MKKNLLKTMLFAAAVVLFGWCATAGAVTYYLPYYVSGGGDSTGIGLRNLSTTATAYVTVKVYDETGGAPVLTETGQIPKNGQWTKVLSDGVSREGWILVESDQALAGLCFVGKDDCMMDVPITDTASTSLVVPHGAQNQSWDTIAYLANPNSASARVKFDFHNSNGAILSQQSANIPALGSAQVSYSSILKGAQASGGSLSITCEQPVVAFALYSNRKTGAYWFAGINALSTDTDESDEETDCYEFDGTWSGSSTPIPSGCGGTLNVSFTVYQSKISGSYTDSDGYKVEIEGAISGDGSIYGFSTYGYDPDVFFTGEASVNSMSGEWINTENCYGTWRMTKK